MSRTTSGKIKHLLTSSSLLSLTDIATGNSGILPSEATQPELKKINDQLDMLIWEQLFAAHGADREIEAGLDVRATVNPPHFSNELHLTELNPGDVAQHPE